MMDAAAGAFRGVSGSDIYALAMVRLLSLLSTAAVVSAAVLLAVPAAAAISDWSSGERAAVRLLAAGVGADGRLAAAIEIALPKGWQTYWRFPGDGGVAPLIDFSRSRNIGVPEVSFPLPQRAIEAGQTSNVYFDGVVLPVAGAVLNPAMPVDLAVTVDLGVCHEVCVPDHVEAHLRVPAGEADRTAAAAISAARALVPGAPQPGLLAVDGISRVGGSDQDPVFDVAITAPDAAKAIVFVEAPFGWHPATPQLVKAAGNKAIYSVATDHPTGQGPLANAAFRVTVAAAGKSIEQTVLLQ
jgi:suppressor for copper-sensitivity B